MVKSAQEAKERLGGIINITMTPFETDYSINYKAFAENIERVLDLGYDGLLIGAQYGEFVTMYTEERAELLRRTMDIVGDRVPVLLGAPSADPRVVAELTKLASDLGGIPMLTAPYVSEVTEKHIFDYFKHIAPMSKTGIVIYNMPEIGYIIPPHLLEQLAEIPNIIGVKQGDLTPKVIDRIAGNLSGRWRLMCASDLHLYGPLMRGFHGASCSNSSCIPELILKGYRSFKQGNVEKAIELHQLWYPLRQLLRELGQPQTIKAVMNLRGWFGGHVRAPLQDLNTKEIDRVRQVLRGIAKHPDSGLKDFA
ncbi:dihydrodipicolinate synthase family protein [Shumkonia mesophila]|uniref:dihydrodipicolinate synthase family protein n=1 Tax=Shumkonia mesophila TaxID=2838854 RepID=UPI00293505C1|nr:dihydrodipicolinate synthase family protein [Shumkonia mesophila]